MAIGIKNNNTQTPIPELNKFHDLIRGLYVPKGQPYLLMSLSCIFDELNISYKYEMFTIALTLGHPLSLSLDSVSIEFSETVWCEEP